MHLHRLCSLHCQGKPILLHLLRLRRLGPRSPVFPQDHALVAGRPTIGWTGAHSMLALRASLLLGPVSSRGRTSSRRTSRLSRFTPHPTCKRCLATTLTSSSNQRSVRISSASA